MGRGREERGGGRGEGEGGKRRREGKGGGRGRRGKGEGEDGGRGNEREEEGEEVRGKGEGGKGGGRREGEGGGSEGGGQIITVQWLCASLQKDKHGKLTNTYMHKRNIQVTFILYMSTCRTHRTPLHQHFVDRFLQLKNPLANRPAMFQLKRSQEDALTNRKGEA